MITIVITGPSGSGKTYLSNKLSKVFDNSIVIKTDSYYRDNILIRFLSIFLNDIYDRPISIMKNEIKNTLRSINKKDRFIPIYKYDFKRKYSSQSKTRIKYKSDNQLLILEGIFAHRLELNYKKTTNIICQEQKNICFTRRLKRDLSERNRDDREVYKKFNKSWNLYYKNVKHYLKTNNVLSINSQDEISINKLVLHLKTLEKK